VTDVHDLITVRALRPAAGGALAHTDDGKTAFVRGALTDELVVARVVSTGRIVHAETIEVLETSPDRIAPACEFASPGRCGGCELQHATTATQLTWKGRVVADQLQRLGAIEFSGEIIDVGDARGSRTRLRAAVGRNGQLSLRRWKSHDLEELSSCWLADARLVPAFEQAWPAWSEVELRAIGAGDPIAVIRERNAMRVTNLVGEPVSDADAFVSIDGRTMQIGPTSFWQSHRAAPEVLARAVSERAAPAHSGRLIDLFSGVGLFGITASSVHRYDEVHCVEASRAAARDAVANAQSLSTVHTHHAAVDAALVASNVVAGDVVVLDPPRTGAGTEVITALRAAGATRVLYVSCDAATLARDLKSAVASGFRLSELVAWDLFPMTEHVELLAVLDAGSR
jgi:tRNA/tmRNA/rRNA uracil-C5-methylase (TrmA/RlmC/RlmD family)